MPLEIRPAAPGDLPAAIDLLLKANLPTQDLASEHLAFVAEGEAGLSGVIGIESSGPVALLRSLVVAPFARGEGVGRRLVAALERMAIERGTRQLWLLTNDADAFFGGLGFSVRSRDEAPAAIRNSAEYSHLCPADAVLMSKDLS